MTIPKKVIEELCTCIRATIKEFGANSLKDAIIIGPYQIEHVSDIKYLYVPTIATHTLGNIHFKIARFFEDFYNGV